MKILKMEADGSNWVIFKDWFFYAAATASLISHIDGTEALPSPVTYLDLLTDGKKGEIKEYQLELFRWKQDKAIVKQAIASGISDSWLTLFGGEKKGNSNGNVGGCEEPKGEEVTYGNCWHVTQTSGREMCQ